MTVGRCPHYPFFSKAVDGAGNTGIGRGRTGGDDTAQVMSAVGCNHQMHIDVAVKSGPEPDHQPGIPNPGTQVSFGQDRIHDDIRLNLLRQMPVRICRHGDFYALPGLMDILKSTHPDSVNPFHGLMPFVQRFTK